MQYVCCFLVVVYQQVQLWVWSAVQVWVCIWSPVTCQCCVCPLVKCLMDFILLMLGTWLTEQISSLTVSESSNSSLLSLKLMRRDKHDGQVRGGWRWIAQAACTQCVFVVWKVAPSVWMCAGPVIQSDHWRSAAPCVWASEGEREREGGAGRTLTLTGNVCVFKGWGAVDYECVSSPY